MRKDSLESTERLLWQFITAPEGVFKALREEPFVVLPIRGDSRLGAAERLDIYANMYFYRILDSLKEDFPRLLRTIGADRFHNLVTDYLLKHFPTHWSLRYAGRHLPAFLKKHPLSGRWPYLGDLARFEWALLDSFDAADTEVLRPADLKALPADRWGGFRFQLVPSFQLLNLRWNVLERRPGRRTFLLKIWRKGFKVFYAPIEPLEEQLLLQILKGRSFSGLCRQVAGRRGIKKAPSVLRDYLNDWLSEELLAGVAAPKLSVC